MESLIVPVYALFHRKAVSTLYEYVPTVRIAYVIIRHRESEKARNGVEKKRKILFAVDKAGAEKNMEMYSKSGCR